MKTTSTRTLIAGVFVLLGIGVPKIAVAQVSNNPPVDAPAATASADETGQIQKLEQVIVTGSYIPTPADALAVPVTVVGPHEIEDSGVSTNLLDILRKVAPQFSGNDNIGNENAQGNFTSSFGGAQVALHNLTTLVLIDGRRLAFDPAEAQGGNEFVDLNMIPVAAIDRIELLSDGASALYGSDALGGVINIILKTNYKGWEVGAHYGFSDNPGHYSERSAYIVGGVSNGKTSIMVGFEYEKNNPIYLKDRPFTNPIYGTYTYAGELQVFNQSTESGVYYRLNPGVNAPPGGAQYNISQLVAMGIYSPLSNTQALQGFNLANAETLEQSMKRESVVINLDHKIFREHLEGFGNLIFSHVITESALNPQPLSAYVSTPITDVEITGVTPPPSGTTYIPISAPTNPFSATFLNGASDYNSGNLVFPNDRFIVFPRIYRDDDTMFRTVAGLRGRINENCSWEIAANLNRYQLDYTNSGLFDTANVDAALANGTLNPFAYSQASGALPGDIIGTAFANMVSSLNSFDVLFRGTPFPLPGGRFGFAIGASYVFESLSAAVDANSLPDPNTGSTVGWTDAISLQPFEAHRKLTSVYGEVEMPLVGADQNIRGIHSLTLDVAGRIDDYTVVGNSSVPKLALSYEPFDDQFKIRGSLGRAFVAPTLFDLFGPSSTGSTPPITFNNYGGGTSELVQFKQVDESNRDLKPSTASTWTVGFVYAPKAVRGLSVSGDFFETVQKNIVGTFNPSSVVQSVELLGTASPYASYVHFENPNGPGPTAPGQISTAVPSNVYIDLPFINESSQGIKGIDSTVEYAFNTIAAGNFDLTSTWTIYNSFTLQQIASEDYYQYAGHASVDQGTIPRFRSYTTLDWRFHGWGFDIAQTFIPSVTDIGQGGDAASPPIKVDSYQQYDAAIFCKLSALKLNHWLDGLTVRIGVNDIFNKYPPLAQNAFPNTNADLGTYNGGVGRLFYVEGNYKFLVSPEKFGINY